MRGSTSAGMPVPVSRTPSATKAPRSPTASSSPSTTLRAEIASVPPPGIASRALSAMLRSASSNSPGSTATGQMPGSTESLISMAPRSHRDRLERAPVGGNGQRLDQPVGVAADDHEEVVEIVRDAAGELAHGLEPLRLLRAASAASR